LRPIHWVFTHLGVLLVGGIIMWGVWGWNRPMVPAPTVSAPVEAVQPGQDKTVTSKPAPGLPDVKYDVTNPGDNRRVITSNPPSVTAADPRKVAHEADESVVSTFSWECVKTPQGEICGSPSDPEYVLVRNGAGFTAVQKPGEKRKVDDVTTEINTHAAPPGTVPSYHLGFGVVVSAVGGSINAVAGPQYQNLAWGGIYRITLGYGFATSPFQMGYSGALEWVFPL